MARPQIYLTKDKKIRVGEKSPDGYVPADLAQSLADALEAMLELGDFQDIRDNARAALANYRKGEL